MVDTAQHELHFSFISFLVGCIALSILFTWLYNNNSRSIWAAFFYHWLFTYTAQVVGSYIIRTSSYNWLEYSPFILAALIIVVVWGPKTLCRMPTNE